MVSNDIILLSWHLLLQSITPFLQLHGIAFFFLQLHFRKPYGRLSKRVDSNEGIPLIKRYKIGLSHIELTISVITLIIAKHKLKFSKYCDKAVTSLSKISFSIARSKYGQHFLHVSNVNCKCQQTSA